MNLPQRIWIVGPCGSGKSSIADRLAGQLGVAATHLDDLHWRPGWAESSREELISRVTEIARGERWVMDGNYGYARRALAERIEFYVWLDLPLRVTLPRVLRRTLRRWRRREACCNGNYESLSRIFAHRDSILWWAITSHRRRRAELSEELAARPHVRLRTQRQIDRWLAESDSLRRGPIG